MVKLLQLHFVLNCTQVSMWLNVEIVEDIFVISIGVNCFNLHMLDKYGLFCYIVLQSMSKYQI